MFDAIVWNTERVRAYLEGEEINADATPEKRAYLFRANAATIARCALSLMAAADYRELIAKENAR